MGMKLSFVLFPVTGGTLTRALVLLMKFSIRVETSELPVGWLG